MKPLTTLQRIHLRRVADHLPDSMKRKGFPGWPVNTFDMRALAALERKGLVQSRIHTWHQGIQKNVVGATCSPMQGAPRSMHNRGQVLMFQIVATSLLAVVFMIWSSGGYLNQLIKAVFLAATLWGVFESAKVLGYIVKL